MKKRASQERHVLAIALECCYVLRLLYLQRALDESSYTVSCETIINKPFIFHRDTDSLRLSACMYLYRVCTNWRKNLFVHVAMFFVLFLFYFEDSEKKVNILGTIRLRFATKYSIFFESSKYLEKKTLILISSVQKTTLKLERKQKTTNDIYKISKKSKGRRILPCGTLF